MTMLKMFLVAMLSGVVMAPPSTAADQLLSVGLGFEFSSGSFGTGVRTDSIVVPVTVAITPGDRAAFSVEIPYVRQSNGNVVAGQFRQMMGQQPYATTATGVMGTPGSGAGMTGGSPLASSSGNRAQTGLGDITLRAGYIIIQEGEIVPEIRPHLTVKVPTADKDRGLGTGKFDEGLAVAVSKWFGDWQTMIEPGYTLQGKTAGLDLKNYFSCNGGIGYQLTESLMPALIIKSSTALTAKATALLEARLKMSYQATSTTGIDFYAGKGLTSATADYSVGLNVFHDF